MKIIVYFLQNPLYLRKILVPLCYNPGIFLMETKDLNRIKVMLAEKKKTNKWLAEQLGKDPITISKRVNNVAQPNVEMFIQLARILDVSVNDLLWTKDTL